MSAWAFKAGFVVGLFVAVSVASAVTLIEGTDARAEPFKKAVAALSKDIAAGSLDQAKGDYAGTGADLELLKAYVDGVNAVKGLHAAVDAKFGADPKREIRGLDTGVARMGVHDFNTVIFYDDPDLASSSADSPLGVGIEFRRVGGAWKVRSLASKPNTPEEHIKRLKAYTEAVNAVKAKVERGAYANANAAAGAAEEAVSLLWPMTHAPATRPKR
jgi:hypothetical protein